jgi:hypothetical protein
MNTYWLKRVDNIRNKVSLRDLIDKYHIECQSQGDITQLHCPFHGNDAHASARLYDTNTMYCWVCSRSWDVINFIKDYQKLPKFSDACRFLEELYHIEKPDLIETYQEPSFDDYLKNEEFINKAGVKERDFEKEFNQISKILMRNKNHFTLSQYSRYFCYLDNLYSSYKLKRYSGDLSLQVSILTLHEEVSKQLN